MRADQKYCLTIGVARMEGKEKTRVKYKICSENIDAYPPKPDENYSVLLFVYRNSRFLYSRVIILLELAMIYSTVCLISIVLD